MKSPITGKQMKLKDEERKLTFRKEVFKVRYVYFFCEKSEEKFTTSLLDEVNLKQVYFRYRKQNGIPTAETIKDIRAKYRVSNLLMGKILGLGQNSYRLYETGEMPSISNGRLINAIVETEEFEKQVELSKNILKPKEYAKLKSNIETIKSQEDKNKWLIQFENKLLNMEYPGEYTGYKKFDRNILSQVISFFDLKLKDLFKTHLNTLLFYSDFVNFKRTGYSITGCKYIAGKSWFIPEKHNELYILLNTDNKIIMKMHDFGDGHFGDVIKSNISFNKNLFTEAELNSLNIVVVNFKKTLKSDTLVNLVKSQIRNQAIKQNKLISYNKHAFGLEGMESE